MSHLDKFGREGRFGSACEEYWRRAFIEAGFGVFPMCWADRWGAPMFEARRARNVAPDFLVCRNGLSTLVDVKGKSICPRYVIRQRMQTGIEIRLHKQYRAVQEATGQRVALAFLHADRTDVHLGYLDEIEEDAQWRYDFAEPDWIAAHPGHAFADRPMVFYNIDPNHGTRFEVMKVKRDILRWMEIRRLAQLPDPRWPWEHRRRPPLPGQQTFPDWE